MHEKSRTERVRRSVISAAMLAALLTACTSGCGKKAAPPQPDPASHRATAEGDVVGFQGRYGSHAWLGIPYARPPVGELRWRKPQPPAPRKQPLTALAFASPCTQYASAIGGVTTARPGTPVGSEDCLYLNIWAPRLAAGDVPVENDRLPVMVWIHGGGNTIGEGGFYNGGNLAATHKLVVVTLNYRLGPFGWFRHAALRDSAADGEDQSGNFGTLDLVRALAWVRENISAFGGDPDNVTVFGESAGGQNVVSLLVSPRAAGLFQRAIVESGGIWTSTASQAENFTDDAQPGDANSSGEALLRLLVADRIASDRGAAKAHLEEMSAAEIERYLRGKTNFEILSAYEPRARTGMIRMPKVFRDGVVLPRETPMERLSRPGVFNRVPVIFGTNRDENKLFMFGDSAWVRRILWLIPRLRDRQRYNVTAEYLSKIWKAVGADQPATAIQAARTGGVFVYRFDWDEEPRILGADTAEMLGAAHGFEIPFVFGHFDLGREGNVIFTEKNEAGRRALSAAMMSYWAEFAYSGAPGRGRDGRLPEWTPWGSANSGGPRFMVLDTPAGGGPRMSSGALTRGGVLAAIDDDPRLPTRRDKCRVFHEIASWSLGLTREQYPTVGREGCTDYPFAEYPW